jgi:hypothetical protein
MEGKNSPQELIRRMEERLLVPEVRKSGKELDELLADDFIEIGTSGVYNKRQIIESLKDEPPTKRSLFDFKTFTLAPDVILVTYRIDQYISSDSSPVHSMRSSIWKLLDGRWQMVFHQGTIAKDKLQHTGIM